MVAAIHWYIHVRGLTSRYSYGTTPTKRQYTGQVSEMATIGLYFYGARFYDPALSRFTTADTIIPGAGNVQAWDRYAAMLNNPVKFIDPSGHRPCDGKNLDGACTTVTNADLQALITMNYGWKTEGSWSRGNLYKLLDYGST